MTGTTFFATEVVPVYRGSTISKGCAGALHVLMVNTVAYKTCVPPPYTAAVAAEGSMCWSELGPPLRSRPPGHSVI